MTANYLDPVNATRSKFPCGITDIKELGKRYHNVNLFSLSGLAIEENLAPQSLGFQVGTPTEAVQPNTVLSWRVCPIHNTRFLYSGWSGTIKYRIIITHRGSTLNVNGPVRVAYVPCNDSIGASTGYVAPTAAVPIPKVATGGRNSTVYISPVFGDLSYQGTILSDFSVRQAAGKFVMNQPFSSYVSTPIEWFYPIDGNVYYIDVIAPFTSEMNILPTSPSDPASAEANVYNGRVAIQMPYLLNDVNIEIFEAFGDDFEFYGWCPKEEMSATRVSLGSGWNPNAGTIVGGGIVTGKH